MKFTRKTKPVTMKSALVRSLQIPLGLALGFGIATTVLHFVPIQTMTLDGAKPEPTNVQESVPGEARLEKMIASGKCWTGGEGHPAPTRVWIHTEDVRVGARYELKGEAMVTKALDQIFNGTKTNLDIAAFCE